MTVMTHASATWREIASQPATWEHALGLPGLAAPVIGSASERVLYLGCGTSAFMAQSIANLRERAGHGESHWAFASEVPSARNYDRVVAITRSGTTTEAIEALAAYAGRARRVAVCAVQDMPVTNEADEMVLLDFADETSVVQTRFPTTLLVAVRAALGEDVLHLPSACASALAAGPGLDPTAYGHFVILGRGWAIGLAHESALKIRETAQAWAESYPALDYRHGPIAVAHEGTLVWMHGPAARGLSEDIRAVRATPWHLDLDPMISLVLTQQLAVELAAARGLDPDHPRALTRSVVLNPPHNDIPSHAGVPS